MKVDTECLSLSLSLSLLNSKTKYTSQTPPKSTMSDLNINILIAL